MDFDCRDIVIYDDDGGAVYSGPRFFRCKIGGCERLMTHRLVHEHVACPGRIPGVICGNRQWKPAMNVSEQEQAQILSGEIPTFDWEMDLITEKVRMIPVAGPMPKVIYKEGVGE